MERIEEDYAFTLANPALLTNFVNRLPEKFRIQYIQRALDHDNTRTFDDLMKFIAGCLRAMERDPGEWADAVSSMKKANNTNVRGCIVNNSVPRVSTKLAVTAVETAMTTKPTTPAYSHTVAGNPDYSQYTCAFSCIPSHANWLFLKYLALNLTTCREYIQQNNRCMNCLRRHTIENCNSFRNCFNFKERHNSTLCPNANASRTENTTNVRKLKIILPPLQIMLI